MWAARDSPHSTEGRNSAPTPWPPGADKNE